jgi:hypothetical protein
MFLFIFQLDFPLPVPLADAQKTSQLFYYFKSRSIGYLELMGSKRVASTFLPEPFAHNVFDLKRLIYVLA